ncbi:MAG: hypothetical protein J6Y85_00555 [Alphaproteobacteria bacterium]|nr:hypothetical protein [Alphaproteobacteria bacterium]
MKNTKPKYLTFIKLFAILIVIFVIIIALCDFTPSPQPQEITIPFTR